MIYLDFAATTPVDPRVREAMNLCVETCWANPSSPHAEGRKARRAIETARERMALRLDVQPHEIVFTASGSEANTLALSGATEQWQATHGATGNVVLLSIEHSCSAKAADRLRSMGWAITLLPVDADGLLNPESLRTALRQDTAIVSVQWANNEVGTIQPIEECMAICAERGIPFHTDAVQPIGQLPLPRLPDLTTIAAHKFYGPKGSAALIVRDHVRLAPQIIGGGQEFGLRAGTENTPAIVGMAAALEIALAEQPGDTRRLTGLRDAFIAELEALPGVTLNGHRTKRLPNNIHLRFEGMSGESLVIRLDQLNVCAATGSACSTGATKPSHVLEAMGKTKAAAMENVRFSLGRSTTKRDLDTVVAHLRMLMS